MKRHNVRLMKSLNAFPMSSNPLVVRKQKRKFRKVRKFAESKRIYVDDAAKILLRRHLKNRSFVPKIQQGSLICIHESCYYGMAFKVLYKTGPNFVVEFAGWTLASCVLTSKPAIPTDRFRIRRKHVALCEADVYTTHREVTIAEIVSLCKAGRSNERYRDYFEEEAWKLAFSYSDSCR